MQRQSSMRLLVQPPLGVGTRFSKRSARGASSVPRFCMSKPSSKRSFTMMSASSNLLEQGDFDAMHKELKAYDERREQVIKRSRDVGKLSKQAIFSLHRSAMDEAQLRLEAAEKAAKELLPIIHSYPTLRSGSFSNAVEEYAEAVVFREYLATGRLLPRKQVELAEMEEYLGGVLDFTGELNRYAVARATVRDKVAVQRCRDLVEEIMGQFLQFDLRNGALRKKFDGLKYTLKKLENTLYELSLTEAGVSKKPEDVQDPEAAAPASRQPGDDVDE